MNDPLIQEFFINSVLKTLGKSYCDKSVTSPPPLFEFNVLFEWPLAAKNLKKITGLLLKKEGICFAVKLIGIREISIVQKKQTF